MSEPSTTIAALLDAEARARQLFDECVRRELIVPGKTEQQLSEEVQDLAREMFDVRRYWHKRIVRAGRNTLLPYAENPPDLAIQRDDIVFFDFGPVFEDWEADSSGGASSSATIPASASSSPISSAAGSSARRIFARTARSPPRGSTPTSASSRAALAGSSATCTAVT